MEQNFYEKKGFIFGVLSITLPIFIVILVTLTLIFPEVFLRYSGVLTFYSLLIAIIIFLLNQFNDKIKEREKGLSILSNFKQEANLIEKQLDFFSSLQLGAPPVHTMSFFSDDFSSLPQEINSRKLDFLKTEIFFANDKIDTLNEIRDKIWDIVWDKNEKELEKISKRKIIENALIEVQNASNDLRKTLRSIKSFISSFGIN